MTFIPIAWHFRATSLPMRPRPMTPSVLPASSTPLNLFFSHLVIFERPVGLGDIAREGKKHRDGVLRGGRRRATRRIHHENAKFGRGVEIHIVDSDAGAADDLQLPGLQHQLTVDGGDCCER